MTLAPDASGYWNTLGVVQYRCDLLEEAVATFEKAIGFDSVGSVTDWLFLAMALERLGRHDSAMEWYEKAESAIRAQSDVSDEHSRFQEEAAEVVGGDQSPR